MTKTIVSLFPMVVAIFVMSQPASAAEWRGEWETAPAFLIVYVNDTDAVYQRAIKSGATSLGDPSDMPWGDRWATVRDGWGNTWQIATAQG